MKRTEETDSTQHRSMNAEMNTFQQSSEKQLFRLSENFVVPQNHASYTVDDLRTWHLFLDDHLRTIDRYPERFNQAYLEGLHGLKLSNTEIPKESHLNQHLAPTGWRAVFVDGYLPPKVYMDLILSRTFPVARNLRSLQHLDLSPVPDFLHDVFGHLPMLFSGDYRAYLLRVCSFMRNTRPESQDTEIYLMNRQISHLKSLGEKESERVAALELRLSRLQREAEAKPSKLALLERIFLWSIEFGLFGTSGNHQIYGAGLLSSPREVEAVCSKSARVVSYTGDVIRYGICFSGGQEQFFLASGYPQLHEVLDQFAADNGLFSMERS